MEEGLTKWVLQKLIELLRKMWFCVVGFTRNWVESDGFGFVDGVILDSGGEEQREV
jgi:hypothetical protein